MVLSQERSFIAKSANVIETLDALYSPIDEENARIKRIYRIREADVYNEIIFSDFKRDDL